MSTARKALAEAFWNEITEDDVRVVVRGVLTRAKAGEPEAIVALARLFDGVTIPSAPVVAPLPVEVVGLLPPRAEPAPIVSLDDDEDMGKELAAAPNAPDLVGLRGKLKVALAGRKTKSAREDSLATEVGSSRATIAAAMQSRPDFVKRDGMWHLVKIELKQDADSANQIRQAVLPVLHENGRMATSQIAAATGYGESRVRECLIEHDWFKMKHGKWELTSEGKAA
jgi:hypothetical protein